MAKVDIFSGFLGAGKTTLIKKLIKEAYKGEKVVLIENEFGEIGIDGGFLKEAGIEITEMNSGCICCSLVGDFSEALVKVVNEFHPDRILIEPSGVGKLSDVIKAVEGAECDELQLNAFTTVADVKKCKMYMKNFGEFYNDQIKNALCIILSHTQSATEEKIAESIALLREHNEDAVIVTTPWDELTGEAILSAMEHENTLKAALEKLEKEDECPVCGHHHEHHHEHDEDCDCGCHDHDEHEHHEHHHDHEEHEHHHEHHHDHEEHEHHHEHHHDHEEHGHHHEHHHDHDEHEHHHDHGEDCTCGCHDHDHEHGHHHHHHADDVFTSWGAETGRKYTKEEIENALASLSEEARFGIILRAKGIVAGESSWIHYDYIPGESDVREGGADIIGRICVIGSNINKKALAELFKVKE
ncbi:MAG: cobalamin biosynthesis protein CobW [Clostridia bacterium]|nr:cobalamin biosynthesis protein CobW [Clostridia bacterium]